MDLAATFDSSQGNQPNFRHTRSQNLLCLLLISPGFGRHTYFPLS